MPTEPDAPAALVQLRGAFAALVAVERLSRAFESLVIGAACAWILAGLARAGGGAAAERAALVPCLVAGLLSGASWMVERWRDRGAIAARAERVLAAPQLLDTALGAGASPGWSELLARRALARFDRARLWRAAGPAFAATLALVLLAAGARELLVRAAAEEPALTPLAGSWNSLADALEAPSGAPGATAPSALAAELREAARLETRGELASQAARELLERAAAALGANGTPAPGADSPRRPEAETLLGALGRAYALPPAGAGSSPAALGTTTPSAGGSSGVPSGTDDGTMGGSTVSGPVRLPAPPGALAAGADGELRPTLPARWWPREQDSLVEAWIEHQQHTRSKR